MIPESDVNKQWDPGECVGVTISSFEVGDMTAEDDQILEGESRTKLDSHANMVVVGMNAYVISPTGKTVEVNPFTPEYDSLKDVAVVDAAVAAAAAGVLVAVVALLWLLLSLAVVW